MHGAHPYNSSKTRTILRNIAIMQLILSVNELKTILLEFEVTVRTGGITGYFWQNLKIFEVLEYCGNRF